ncbi:MAG TPA: M36 family metallopeptidase, partial [Urbifossiella sp.]|nr:M36 family metallopeptidase [Urbifossiella sp.]
MRARRDRLRLTSLSLTRLEDRSVPAVITLPPPPPYNPDVETGGLDTQPQSYFLGGSDYLTGPQSGDPLTLAQQALATFAPGLGLTTADIANPYVTSSYSDGTGGMFHAYFRQTYNGLDVINANIGVHLTADGQVLTVNGGFVPGLGSTATGVIPAPTVNASDAITAAAAYFGIALASAPSLTSPASMLDEQTVFSDPSASTDPITAKLVYVNTPAGAREAWEFQLDVPGGQHWYDVAVDTATGQVVFWADWVDNYSATYTVLQPPTLDPAAGPRSTLVNPWDTSASPFGWQDTNGVAGADHTDTEGNNVDAQADLFDTNASNVRPDAGTGLVFNYPLNLSAAPIGSVDAAVTNLYYMNNWLHDIHYQYGFTPAAGNFQQNNYGLGGIGGDPVQADAQDGSELFPPNTDNANFATPPDGFEPRMQMYIFADTNPFRDGDFATQVMIHEFGHGISNRLTDGPADADALDNVESGGIG